MPNRYVRDAVLASPKWLSLPDDGTRLLFIRLILVADDFGVFDGRAEVIANHAFPTELWDASRVATLKAQLDTLHRAGLIIRFSNAGKPYIAIPQWGNDLRADRLFPAPPVNIDREELTPRGKYGREIGWRNPPGCDPVSILLDVNGQPVRPQPPEWRPAWHQLPKVKKGKKASVVTGGVEEIERAQAASYSQPMTAEVSYPQLVVTGSREEEKKRERIREKEDAAVVAGGFSREQPVTAPQTSQNGDGGDGDGDGRIAFERETGRFQGLTDALQAHWQSMFEFPVPDQLDRAGAWLRAHRAEADAIEREGQGYESFLVRWLLREARTSARTHGT